MKLTIEDCKELKDAGFPQNFSEGNFYAEKDCSFKESQVAQTFFDARTRGTPESELALDKLLSIPTLSELIEECGENILGLNRTHADDGTPNGWVADTHTHECECGKPDCTGFNWEHESGSTPEQAVKNLYIALHKNEAVA